MRRVAITGIGVIAPNGVGNDAFWNAIVEGKSGVSKIESFDPSGLPIQIGGEVKNFDASAYVTDNKHLKVMGRNIRFGLAAAKMAWQDCGLSEGSVDPGRLGVVMGSGIVPMDLTELAPLVARAINGENQFSMSRFAEAGAELLNPLWILKHLPNMLAAHISIAHNAQGPNSTIVTACSAGTQAVGDGLRLIQRGDADVMLCGGADSRLEPLMLVAYNSLGALSRSSRPPEEVSRPFDRERDGFVMSEGAGVLVLEELERARARGARLYAEVRGYGTSLDAYGITRPDPKGTGAARSMELALKDAQANVDDVNYISAHGTSTRLNDLMETTAVKRVFNSHARRISLSSIKSMVGHMIGAAGAVEAAAAALAVNSGVVPPTINLTNPDPACDLDYTPGSAREIKPKLAMVNSFGFGGQNASLVFGPFNGR